MPEDILPCHIRIDKEGNWYHQGLPIINKKIYIHLNQCLSKDPSGRHVLEMNGETCLLEVEDTPFVVKEVSPKTTPGKPTTFFIKLNDETEENLNADTLRVGKEDVLYCKVKDKLYEARFLRAAYYQLAKFLQHDEKGYCLLIKGKKTYLQQQ